VRYTRVQAAEYDNAGRVFRAVLFRDPAGRPAYYAPDGKSLKKAFLRSPLKFGAPITSRFSRSRFHPVLKRHRPHLGIDYGAPVGTPVQTIGDGRVVFAGTKGGAGKMVHIRHVNGYETMYLHLSRIFVRAGERVSQGDRIGLVGASGLATGPHLDFRILQHGSYRNFERLQLPPALPVAKADWEEFVAARDRWLAQLPPLTGAPVLARQQSAGANRPAPSSAP
jgi:murein DD-endopeptidase MepM/ murein hydrolase activator NlpD